MKEEGYKLGETEIHPNSSHLITFLGGSLARLMTPALPSRFTAPLCLLAKCNYFVAKWNTTLFDFPIKLLASIYKHELLTVFTLWCRLPPSAACRLCIRSLCCTERCLPFLTYTPELHFSAGLVIGRPTVGRYCGRHDPRQGPLAGQDPSSPSAHASYQLSPRHFG